MMDLRRFDWLIEKIQDKESMLTDWERSFVDDLEGRRSRYDERFRVSDKQEEILERISEKCI